MLPSLKIVSIIVSCTRSVAGTYAEDGADVYSVAVAQQEQIGVDVLAIKFELGNSTFDARVEGQQRECFANFGFRLAHVVQFDKQTRTQICELLCTFTPLQLGAKLWRQNFVHPPIRILIHQRPTLARAHISKTIMITYESHRGRTYQSKSKITSCLFTRGRGTGAVFVAIVCIRWYVLHAKEITEHTPKNRCISGRFLPILSEHGNRKQYSHSKTFVDVSFPVFCSPESRSSLAHTIAMRPVTPCAYKTEKFSVDTMYIKIGIGNEGDEHSNRRLLHLEITKDVVDIGPIGLFALCLLRADNVTLDPVAERVLVLWSWFGCGDLWQPERLVGVRISGA